MKLAKTDPNSEHTASTAAKPPNIAPVNIKYVNTYIVLSIKTRAITHVYVIGRSRNFFSNIVFMCIVHYYY
jgi:hypothetical protein